MKRYGILIFAIMGSMLGVTSCGDVQSKLETATPATGAAVTISAIDEAEETEDTQKRNVEEKDNTDNDTNSLTCPTTELTVKKMNYNVTETKLGVPGYSTYFYKKKNSEVIADDWRSVHMDPPAISYTLQANEWNEKETPFDKLRQKEEITSVSDVVQRENGDYVFISGMNHIVRMTEQGKIKYKVSLGDLYGKKRSMLVAMAYVGDGKAIVQSQDEYLDTNVYEEQDTSVIHLDLINLKTGEVEKSYVDGWRLCGAIDETYFFAEKDKKVIKIEIATGKIVKKYATEAIWSEGWSDDTTDEDGIFFHDYPITWCTYEGKLYAKHVGGVFQLDEDTPCWNQLITRDDNFTMGPMYNNTFVMLEENKMMLMANRCDEECATDCCLYEWE